MSNQHTNFQETTLKILSKKAKAYDCSIPQLIERIVESTVLKDQMNELFFGRHSNNGNNKTELFTFIDLFAGIGGIRIAFEKQGGKWLFSSEWDKWCQETYFKKFCELPRSDINKILPEEFPSHDILTAGFPCQPFFSLAFQRKRV
jgi:DNA (cytosine-5)-methyltransferase 1